MSNEILKVPIAKIKTVDRLREVYPENDSLKASMIKHGLINPIVIDRDFTLIAGGRRLISAKELQWVEIDCIFRDRVDELTAREIELEENTQRADFTDAEKVKAVLEIHRLKQLKYGKSYQGNKEDGWTLQDTATSIGVSKSTVGMYVSVAEHIEKNPDPEVIDALKVSANQAHKVILYKQEKALEALISGAMVADIANIQPGEAIDETAIVARVDSMYRLGDCRKLIQQLADSSIDFGYTDSPYGINIKELVDSPADLYEKDSMENFAQLWDPLIKEYFRVLKPNAFLFVWTGFESYYYLRNLALSVGFKASPIPHFWVKPNFSGQTNSPTLWAASAVEIGLVLAKGSPVRNRQGDPNFYYIEPINPSEKIHPLEKPSNLNRAILREFAFKGARVLDTFSGSGSIICDCIDEQYDGIGFELEPNYYHAGRLRLIEKLKNPTIPTVGEVDDEALEDEFEIKDEAMSVLLDTKPTTPPEGFELVTCSTCSGAGCDKCLNKGSYLQRLLPLEGASNDKSPEQVSPV